MASGRREHRLRAGRAEAAPSGHAAGTAQTATRRREPLLLAADGSPSSSFFALDLPEKVRRSNARRYLTERRTYGVLCAAGLPGEVAARLASRLFDALARPGADPPGGDDERKVVLRLLRDALPMADRQRLAAEPDDPDLLPDMSPYLLEASSAYGKLTARRTEQVPALAKVAAGDLSRRAAARLLGITRQRVGQLAKKRPGRDEHDPAAKANAIPTAARGTSRPKPLP